MARVKVVTVSTTKGGAGKTTTSVHIAAGLAGDDARVLLVDLDKQGHCATSLGLDAEPGIFDLLVKEMSLRDLVREARPNLHLLPSNSKTMTAQSLVRMEDYEADLFKTRIVEQATGYDYVVFDTIPQGLFQECAVYAADLIIAPAPVDYLGLDGASQFETMVNSVVSRNNLEPITLRVLPMFVDRRTRDAIENVEFLQKGFGEQLLPEIPIAVRMREAIAEGQTIYEFAPKERVAIVYQEICAEIKRLLRG